MPALQSADRPRIVLKESTVITTISRVATPVNYFQLGLSKDLAPFTLSGTPTITDSIYKVTPTTMAKSWKRSSVWYKDYKQLARARWAGPKIELFSPISRSLESWNSS
ncbi:MAG: hypothetical protein R2867_13660 [Caldilineaceae bacterium]